MSAWAKVGGSLPEGPWSSAFWFTVPGQVMSKSNHRQDGRSRGSWDLHRGYALAVHTEAVRHLPAAWPAGQAAQRPQQRPRMAVFCYAASRLDIGNINKSVLDALQGWVMANDRQVVAEASTGRYEEKDQGLLVAVAALDPDVPCAQALAVVAALGGQALAAFDAAGAR